MTEPITLPTTAPCCICGVEITLKGSEQYRALAPGAHFCCCQAHRVLWQKQQASTREANRRKQLSPRLVGCSQCGAEFYPSIHVWQRHQSGLAQRYYCPACVAIPAKDRTQPAERFGVTPEPESPALAEQRELYFRLQAKGALPVCNVYRRVW